MASTRRYSTTESDSNEEQKRRLRDNWLAPAGSAQERRFLKRWATQKGLSEKDRALVREWLSKPDGFEKRNEGFWRAAKNSVLGEIVYETAMERHRKLAWHEWVVACLTTQGVIQPEIADLIGKKPRTVDNIVSSIKQKIVQDLDCDIESVNLAQIARWFLGL